MRIPIDRHNDEIQKNLITWQKKPSLRFVYGEFYKEMISYIRNDVAGKVVEIGSGIGNFKKAYSAAIATDIFPNVGIDQVESAYKLSFADKSLSNLVLFDVFHHLKFPGSTLLEFKRTLNSGGRVIICDPYVSLFGAFVYGIFHPEPIAIFKKIEWLSPADANPDAEYYAAQGNSMRVFRPGSQFRQIIEKDWNIVAIKRHASFSYVLSGGFSKQSFYPHFALGFIRKIEKIFDFLPSIFATRIIVVLEKK